jgi:hypothetical protein
MPRQSGFESVSSSVCVECLTLFLYLRDFSLVYWGVMSFLLYSTYLSNIIYWQILAYEFCLDNVCHSKLSNGG